MGEKSFQLHKREEFLKELLKEVNNPIHKRLLGAYKGDDPLDSMKSELKKILIEVIQHEN